MKRILLALALLLWAAQPACSRADAAVFVRLKPAPTYPASPRFYLVGDSITSAHLQGQGGWRAMLYQALVRAGYNPDFHGSIVNTTDNPPLSSTAVAGLSHSGLDGASGSNWYSSYWDSFNFPSSFPSSPTGDPNIVLIAVGTNDGDTALAATDFSRLIDKALAQVPTARVVMATTPHVEFGATGFDTQAAQVRIEVANRRAAGKPVWLADAHAVSLVTGDSQDGLHPSTSGYRKLADQVWIPTVMRVLEGVR